MQNSSSDFSADAGRQSRFLYGQSDHYSRSRLTQTHEFDVKPINCDTKEVFFSALLISLKLLKSCRKTIKDDSAFMTEFRET